jgi:hypothetical protein
MRVSSNAPVVEVKSKSALVVGLAVPMPTLPEESIRIRSPKVALPFAVEKTKEAVLLADLLVEILAAYDVSAS